MTRIITHRVDLETGDSGDGLGSREGAFLVPPGALI